jgi:23S rRNA pseudouridine955/2504/2580 synthase
MLKIEIPESDVRLDRFLRRSYPFLPQSVLEKDLRKGNVKVNGKKEISSFRLSEGDIVSIYADYEGYSERKANSKILSTEDRSFLESIIIFEDDEVCLVNKPHNISVQGGTGLHKSLDDLFKLYQKNVNYKLMHRLDKDTSGVLIFAKTQDAAKSIAESFKNRVIEKKYLAIVHGCPKNNKGVINAPLLKDFSNHKEKMIVHSDGKEAITHYEVLATKNDFSCLILQPLTGRTHQLRVHMTHIGHPIVGDYKYDSFIKKGHRLHLHSQSIKFPYGSKNKMMTFSAPIDVIDLYSLFEESLPIR